MNPRELETQSTCESESRIEPFNIGYLETAALVLIKYFVERAQTNAASSSEPDPNELLDRDLD